MGSIDDDEWTREWWKFVEASPVFCAIGVCCYVGGNCIKIFKKALYKDLSEADTVNEINTLILFGTFWWKIYFLWYLNQQKGLEDFYQMFHNCLHQWYNKPVLLKCNLKRLISRDLKLSFLELKSF